MDPESHFLRYVFWTDRNTEGRCLAKVYSVMLSMWFVETSMVKTLQSTSRPCYNWPIRSRHLARNADSATDLEPKCWRSFLWTSWRMSLPMCIFWISAEQRTKLQRQAPIKSYRPTPTAISSVNELINCAFAVVSMAYFIGYFRL